MNYKRWDVVAVPYPFIEGRESKRRPGLIVSSDALRQRHGVYWMAMITTSKAGPKDEDIPVTDHARAGLPEHCVIRVPRLATLSDAQISHRLGTVTTKDRNAVSAMLREYLP